MNSTHTAEPIAIIGLRGRFPDARTLEQFWANLVNGVESLKEFTVEEVTEAGIDPSWMNAPGYVRAGSVLEDVEMFDAAFFGFSARDAEIIDPQQRLFLEVAWESLEAAGYDPERFPGDIGIFGGSEQSTYLYQLFRNPDRLAYADPAVLQIGNDKDYLTTQVSYKLNLRGPSLAIQTACSTSLVAVTVACQSLQARQCDMALAGGVSIGVPQKKGYWYQAGGIFSPDGHCRTFDASGQGTVVGNGVAIVVLKRLADALADGDQIHALIRGAAINNDGSTKVGFSAPSIEGQARVIRTAHAMAGVEPETIGYVEAHGTATLLGDPIEFAALNEVFRECTGKRGWCAIGSLKSNVGHLASAAGVSGLIKTVLSLRNRTLVPSLHFKTPNPQIDFANSPFYVNTEVREWKANGSPRRAGASSFGVGGTNAHVVLEEAPEQRPSGPSRDQQILLLSAKTATALDAMTTNIAAHMESHPDLNLADVAFTTQVGRKAFAHRRVIRSDGLTTVQLAMALAKDEARGVLSAVAPSNDRPVVFMFTGQGSQYVNMSRDLYNNEAEYRDSVDHCCDLLKGPLGFDLREVLFAPVGAEEALGARLIRTSVTQPALFTIEYSLARMWMKWGVRPKAMIGHSIGEYVAACISGVFGLEDALRLVALRGQMMEQMPTGAMLSVPLGESEAAALANETLSLAAANAPYLSVLSGPQPDIDRLAAELGGRGLQVRQLLTSHAFHSAVMEPILEPYAALVASIERRAPRIPFISNVTGTWITAANVEDPSYWSRHLRSTVRFAAGVAELQRLSDPIFLEVGPGRTLQTFVRQAPTESPSSVLLSSLRSPQESENDASFAIGTLAQLWLNGANVDWNAYSARESRRRVELPTYAFERQRYWIGTSAKSGVAESTANPAKPRDILNWFYLPAWKPAVSFRGNGVDHLRGNWLVFVDRAGVGDALCARLRAAECDVVRISAGEAFAQSGPTDFTIRPENPADYLALLKELSTSSAMPKYIAHAWCVTGDEPAEDFDSLQAVGFYSLVYLAQALDKLNVTASLQVGFICDHLQSVLGEAVRCPAKATALGPCKVLPQEFPNLRCRSIDISVGDGELSVIADRVIRELTAEPFESSVAYRQGRRWIQYYEPAKLTAARTPALLRERGVYLVTGGLGNIGLAFAETLARATRCKLVLTGRAVFPPREQWDDWIAMQGAADPTARKILRVKAIEELGAEVLVASGDCSDLEDMRAVVAAAEQRFGPINAVIHAAGNTATEGFVAARALDRAVAESQFAPKAKAVLILEEVLRERQLDFWFLLSSISGVLGGLDLCAYSAANLFLDAFSAQQQLAGRGKWISVNWDAWQFPADERAFKTTVPNWTDYILPTEGVDAFMRILESAPVQTIVSATNLDERLKKWVYLESLHEAQQASARPAAMHPRPSLSSQFVAPRTPVQKKVAEAWEELLGVAPIGIHDKFFELGGHSLLAIQLIVKIRVLFQVEVAPQRLFEAPTIEQFAASIEADMEKAKADQQRQEEERMAELLTVVEGLSDEEVAALLADPSRLATGVPLNG
jgi:acyl transferase domain-containing protein/acyl carrier protein